MFDFMKCVQRAKDTALDYKARYIGRLEQWRIAEWDDYFLVTHIREQNLLPKHSHSVPGRKERPASLDSSYVAIFTLHWISHKKKKKRTSRTLTCS
ncbi:hypothetical protein CEXT_101911 [Caerostris extrusa]|uniref:Uncharacterized protein n=1 Tax=Caerostris extrusa TaxID=172846 RepID=A0AAV4Y059_CAEEX|nr:hypothetical protein CEXT_101911 [Caerostris extrusa]